MNYVKQTDPRTRYAVSASKPDNIVYRNLIAYYLRLLAWRGGMYEYRILDVLRVIDGDTVDLSIDLGFGLRARLRVRLAKVDTPELHGPRGQAAKSYTERWLSEREGNLKVRTVPANPSSVGIGDGAFGRWLGFILTRNGVDMLNADLIDNGHVK